MRQVVWFMIQCGEPFNLRFSLRVPLNFFQLTSFWPKQTFVMEEVDSRKQKNSSLLHIGIFSNTILRKVKKVVLMIAWFLKKKLNNIKLDFIKLSVDYSWHKADLKLIKKLWMNFQKQFSQNAKSLDQKVFIYAAVTSTWVSCLDLTISLPKQSPSFQKLLESGKILLLTKTSKTSETLCIQQLMSIIIMKQSSIYQQSKFSLKMNQDQMISQQLKHICHLVLYA